MLKSWQTRQAIGLMMVGGIAWLLSGCGGGSSGAVPILLPNHETAPGQHLYVANQNATGSATVLRFDQVLTQANGAAEVADATFTNFNTVGEVSIDVFGNMLACDTGNNLVANYEGAESFTTAVTTPSSTLVASAPSGAVHDSSNNFIYAVLSHQVIEQFSDTGNPLGTLADSTLTSPRVVAFDDTHDVGGGASKGVLFVAGTNGNAGALDIVTLPQGLVGTGDIANNPNVLHVTQIAGVNLVSPTNLAYDPVDLQLWIADPGAGSSGIVFRIDHANTLVAGSQVTGAAFQITANNVAVDTSSGFAVLMTLSNTTAVNTLSIFGPATGVTNATGLVAAAQIPTPSNLLLTGVTDPVGMVDDSDH